MPAAKGNRSPAAANDAGVMAGQDARLSRYLTDGVDLYRCLDGVLAHPGQLVALENCRTLELILVPIKDLHARRLRGVTPAGGENEHERFAP